MNPRPLECDSSMSPSHQFPQKIHDFPPILRASLISRPQDFLSETVNDYNEREEKVKMGSEFWANGGLLCRKLVAPSNSLANYPQKTSRAICGKWRTNGALTPIPSTNLQFRFEKIARSPLFLFRFYLCEKRKRKVCRSFCTDLRAQSKVYLQG